jgi:hypothetical protein
MRTEWDQVLAVVQSLFRLSSMDVEAVLHLRNFLCFASKKLVLILGLDSSCLIQQSKE